MSRSRFYRLALAVLVSLPACGRAAATPELDGSTSAEPCANDLVDDPAEPSEPTLSCVDPTATAQAPMSTAPDVDRCWLACAQAADNNCDFSTCDGTQSTEITCYVYLLSCDEAWHAKIDGTVGFAYCTRTCRADDDD